MINSGMYDGIDLPSLVSFCVDGDSCHCGSFWFAQFFMNGSIVVMSSGIDLPSLKSIILGDGCFYETPRVEMISEDGLKE